MNLNFVIVTVKCCLPETNETNFEKNICNDIEKIVTVGSGGQQTIFSTFFYLKNFIIVFILKFLSRLVKHIFMLYKQWRSYTGARGGHGPLVFALAPVMPP